MREETLNIYIYIYTLGKTIYRLSQGQWRNYMNREHICGYIYGTWILSTGNRHLCHPRLVPVTSRISYTSRGVKTCWVGFKQTKHRNKHALFCGTVILTHWGRVTHICVSKLTIIGSDNGLSPGRRQAIIRINAGILLIRTLGTNFGEILSKIGAFSFKKMHLKMSSAKWRPFCLGLSVLSHHP